MKNILRHELSVAVQYFVIVLFALLAPYLKLMAATDHINLAEAWKNIDPYVRSVLLTFVVVAGLRLVVVVFISKLRAA